MNAVAIGNMSITPQFASLKTTQYRCKNIILMKYQRWYTPKVVKIRNVISVENCDIRNERHTELCSVLLFRNAIYNKYFNIFRLTISLEIM